MKLLVFIFLVILSSNIVPQDKSNSSNSLNKITTNDDYDYIAINQMKMWIGNDGMGSHKPYTYEAGLLWPGGENSTLSLAYIDGLLWGGYINNSLFVGGSTFRQGLQAGKILSNGLADDPSLDKYRIYKIKKGWEELPPGPKKERYKKDYEEWPGNDGAPFYDSNNDGTFTAGIDKPLFLGDEVLWCVMNDLDPNRTSNAFGSGPIGLEIQMTVYGYTQSSLNSVIFKKYIIINKSSNVIDSMYFAYFSDPEILNGYDDYAGCDTLLNLAYSYNADSLDEVFYGEIPPALGYKLLQGPIKRSSLNDSAFFKYQWINGYINKDLSSFNLYNGDIWWQCFPVVETDYYSFLNGKTFEPRCHLYFIDIINPIDSNRTNIMCPGDPVNRIGWYEGDGWPNGLIPGDKIMLMGSGPITMAPGDTQEVAIAIIAARGSNNLQSISVLKNTAKIVQYFYDNYTPELSNINYSPPIPEYYYLSQNYPNPFNPYTKIIYELPLPGIVTLKVFDLLGQEIRTLINEEKSAGKYEVEFSSDGLSSGIYFYTFNSRAYTKTKKMLVIK